MQCSKQIPKLKLFSHSDGDNDPYDDDAMKTYEKNDDIDANDDAIDGSDNGTSDDVEVHDDDGINSSNDDGDVFRTALHSTPKPAKKAHKTCRPYSFRDVEESIESFGAEEGQDVKLWMRQFEEMSAAAYWNDVAEEINGNGEAICVHSTQSEHIRKVKESLNCRVCPSRESV
ncbi:uncharacterized protein LOC134206194 [Armigeres subalbatus]|uniref:uncharacterized protein LOC134206194 n=1 Tax=Armigeres subalbatus TaxID=124917 RepID=UPI002ED0A8AD